MHPHSTPEPLRRWTPEDDAMLQTFYPVENIADVAARLGRTYDAVKLRGRKFGLRSPRIRTPRPGEWTTEEDAVLQASYWGTSRAALAEQLGRPEWSIKDRAKRLGLRRDPHATRFRVRSDAFTLLCPETAYVLGFILADGCLYKNTVSIVNTEREIMERIRDALGSDHPLGECWSGQPPRRVYRLLLFDPQVCADLRLRGLTPKKSLTATMPDVPDALFFHFLRGYFDGDGSAYMRPGHQLDISWGSASRVLLEQIAHRLPLLSALAARPIRQASPGQHFWRLTYHGRAALQLADLMYADSGDLSIARKRAIVERFRAYRQSRG